MQAKIPTPWVVVGSGVASYLGHAATMAVPCHYITNGLLSLQREAGLRRHTTQGRQGLKLERERKAKIETHIASNGQQP